MGVVEPAGFCVTVPRIPALLRITHFVRCTEVGEVAADKEKDEEMGLLLPQTGCLLRSSCFVLGVGIS